MKKSLRIYAMAFLVMAILVLAAGAQSAAQNNQPAQSQQNLSSQSPANEANETLSPEAEDKLIREVRHELIMLPWYGVFDNLAFRVDGRTVTLEGQVVKPVTKSDAENAVKRIEGVEKVVNNIEVLPPSPMDDRIRRQVYKSIYSYGPLFKYANMAVPPIHIIVKNARVTLDGVVDSEADKNLATLRANQVRGYSRSPTTCAW
ncbi:MAG: BON domain-containing protein [Acidobacteriota bacterium]|nr:BON domain-containing protein [Acidobacteriota bacterium]